MSKSKKKRTRKNRNDIRVYLDVDAMCALALLKSFPELQNISDNKILRTCLIMVALDAKRDIEESRKSNEIDTKLDSNSDADSLQGGLVSQQDNQEPANTDREEEK